ncbi:CpaE family protein [Cryptosporangium sp. NPDC051539]|uniref:CpaE family protein n=1 Tax=Cryptosporangium sp. NPDC051539 TaxID=3363962 RepID=UPI0037B6ECE5
MTSSHDARQDWPGTRLGAPPQVDGPADETAQPDAAPSPGVPDGEAGDANATVVVDPASLSVPLNGGNPLTAQPILDTAGYPSPPADPNYSTPPAYSPAPPPEYTPPEYVPPQYVPPQYVPPQYAPAQYPPANYAPPGYPPQPPPGQPGAIPPAAAPPPNHQPPQLPVPHHPGANPSKVFGPDATPVQAAWTPDGLLPLPEHADNRLQRFKTSINSGRAAREAAGLASELSQPIANTRRIAVLGIRGGSGKSTVASLLVSAFATHRGDRVLAVDADPDLGSLGLRLGATSPTSLANLGKVPRVWATLDEAERCLGRSQSGAWVLSGERGTAAPEIVPPNAYLGVVHGISRYFAVAVIDAGAGMVTPLNQSVLADAHSIVLATPASIDGVVSARRALEWIREWGPHRLPQTLVALTAMSPQAASIDLNRTAEAFAPFGVVPALLPYDRHLATGSAIEPWRLGERTRNSAVQLAAAVLAKSRQIP